MSSSDYLARLRGSVLGSGCGMRQGGMLMGGAKIFPPGYSNPGKKSGPRTEQQKADRKAASVVRANVIYGKLQTWYDQYKIDNRGEEPKGIQIRNKRYDIKKDFPMGGSNSTYKGMTNNARAIMTPAELIKFKAINKAASASNTARSKFLNDILKRGAGGEEMKRD